MSGEGGVVPVREHEDGSAEEQAGLLRHNTAAANVVRELANEPTSLVLIWCSLIFVLLFFALLAFLCYYQIHLYLTYKDNLCEKNLALWCFVFAITFLVGVGMVLCVSGQVVRIGVLNLFGIRVEQIDLACLRWTTHFYTFIERMTNFFNGVWFWVGTIWIYSINRSKHECPEPLYSFVFYLISSLWLLILIPLTITCLALCFKFASEALCGRSCNLPFFGRGTISAPSVGEERQSPSSSGSGRPPSPAPFTGVRNSRLLNQNSHPTTSSTPPIVTRPPAESRTSEDFIL